MRGAKSWRAATANSGRIEWEGRVRQEAPGSRDGAVLAANMVLGSGLAR